MSAEFITANCFETPRAAARQSDTRSLIKDFKPWLEARLLEVSNKSGPGKAIGYTLTTIGKA